MMPKRADRLFSSPNQFLLPAVTIAELYRYRWRVEIFFKWIKQHLRIKKFFGTFGERRQNPDLDSHLSIRSRGDNEEALESRVDSLHNFTDFEHISFREKIDLSGAYRNKLQKRNYYPG